MKILIIEPYFTGSHRAWAEGYQKFSNHDVAILSLPGVFWKWRMHGGAVTLAKKFLASTSLPDVIMATDMLDLTTFLSLTRRRTANIPSAIYFHENQLSYPWSPQDRDVLNKRDQHYGFINYVSALTADAVYFNSKYHKEDFIKRVRSFLKHFPDYTGLENIDEITAKSKILPLGLDLLRFDAYKPAESYSGTRSKPLILWNHRWEYDKNFEEFMRALFLLAEKGLEFEVAILGECFSESPNEFDMARKKLGEKVIQFGYVKEFSEYAKWLWQADILPVTSKQDFFGASIVEAIYCQCLPILPNRLSYPEQIPPEVQSTVIYETFDDFVCCLERALSGQVVLNDSLRDVVKRFSWQVVAPLYDDYLEDVVNAWN